MHQPRPTAALVLAVSARPTERARPMAAGPEPARPARPADAFDLDHVFEVVAALSRANGAADESSSRVHSITLDRSHLEVLLSIPERPGGAAAAI